MADFFYPQTNQALHDLRRTNNKLDDNNDQLHDFMDRQMHGENPDPNEFMQIMEQRSNAKSAMQAQFRLYEKPMKTVLNETK